MTPLPASALALNARFDTMSHASGLPANPGVNVCATNTVVERRTHLVKVRIHGHWVLQRVAYQQPATPSCTVVVSPDASLAPVAPSGDLWPSVQFGLYGNTAYSDCTLAAVGDLEQIYRGVNAPLVASADDASPAADPFVAEYLNLTGGSTTAGVAVPSVLNAWQQAPIGGLQISSYATVGLDQSSIQSTLDSGAPVLAWFKLPTLDASNYLGFPTAPWTTSGVTADTATSGTHVGVIVGADAEYLDIVTWGYVQQVTWQWWNSWALGAWRVHAS